MNNNQELEMLRKAIGYKPEPLSVFEQNRNCGLSGQEDLNLDQKRFIEQEKVWYLFFKWSFLILLFIALAYVGYKILSGENEVEFNFGGMPLN